MLIKLAVCLQFWLLESTIRTSSFYVQQQFWDLLKNKRNVKCRSKCFFLLQVLLFCWDAMVPKKNSCNAVCHTTNIHVSRGTVWKYFTDCYSPTQSWWYTFYLFSWQSWPLIMEWNKHGVVSLQLSIIKWEHESERYLKT